MDENKTVFRHIESNELLYQRLKSEMEKQCYGAGLNYLMR